MYFCIRNSSSNCLCNLPDSLIIYYVQCVHQFFSGKMTEIIGHKTVHMLFQRSDCFHKRSLKIITNTHDLSGRLHLCSQRTFCTDKFIKWKSWNLNNTIIKHRFKTCICLLCNCIFNLVKCISKRNLCCYLCDWITRSFRCKRRRTADTWIHFNNTIFK